MATFAEELNNLIQRYLDQGTTTLDDILSDMELKVMELQEQEED